MLEAGAAADEGLEMIISDWDLAKLLRSVQRGHDAAAVRLLVRRYQLPVCEAEAWVVAVGAAQAWKIVPLRY